MKERHVYINGSRGIPVHYGGFETFVEELTANKVSEYIKHHVACLAESKKCTFVHNRAECFNIKKKNIRAANAIYYDIAALRYSKERVKRLFSWDYIVGEYERMVR
ncbi:hypothetical protein OfM1_21510 [Lactovum odontotermitis]